MPLPCATPNADPVTDAKGNALPDPDLRDHENVPLPPVRVTYEADATARLSTIEYRTAIDDYLAAEVHPYVPDAWIDHDKTRVSYEIPFARHFYALRSAPAHIRHRRRDQTVGGRNPGPAPRGYGVKTIRLRHLARVNPDTPEFESAADDTDVTFVPLEAVWSDGVDVSRTRPRAEVAQGYTRFREGDIVVPKITPTFEADRSTIVQCLPQGFGVGTTELHVIRCGPNLDPRYLRYLVSSRHFLSGGEAEMTGVAGQKRVPDSWLRNFPVPSADLDTQRAIADFLDSETARLDALIAKRGLLVALTWTRHRSVVAGRTNAALVLDLNSGVDRVPVGFRVMKLKRCLSQVDYGIGMAAQADGQYAVLGMGNVNDFGAIDGPVNSYVDAVDQNLLLRRGDLLFNRTNSLAKVGKVGYVRELGGPTTFASYLVRLRTNGNASPGYLNYLLNTEEVLTLARASALPSIGQANLNPARYGNLRIPLPRLEIQESVVRESDLQRGRVDALTTSIRRQICVLREHRQGLITAAVTGELDIPGVAA